MYNQHKLLEMLIIFIITILYLHSSFAFSIHSIVEDLPRISIKYHQIIIVAPKTKLGYIVEVLIIDSFDANFVVLITICFPKISNS